MMRRIRMIRLLRAWLMAIMPFAMPMAAVAQITIPMPPIRGFPNNVDIGPGGITADTDSFRIFIHNNTSHPIKVTVRWYQWNDNSSWFEGADKFQTVYYDFAPGEKSYIGNTRGRNIYFKAKSMNSPHVWQGPNGNFISVDMGSRFSEFTQTFNLR